MMMRWTKLAPWESEFPFQGSLTSTFLGNLYKRAFGKPDVVLLFRVQGVGQKFRFQGLGFGASGFGIEVSGIRV